MQKLLITETKMKYFIRDFDTDGFHARASKMQEIAVKAANAL